MPPSAVEPRVERALTDAFLNLEGYLRATLKKLHKEKGLLVSDAFNIQKLDNTLRTLRVNMDALGYSDAIKTQLAGLATLHQEVMTDRAFIKHEYGEEFLKESENAVRLLMQGAEMELLALEGEVTEALGQLLRRSILGGGEYGDLIDDIAARLQTARYRAMTLASTTLHSFNSAVMVKHAKEAGIEWFAYVGPDDSVTREWCDHWVGRRGTIEMFEKTADKWGRGGKHPQPKPVATWRGGYNCRHGFAPVAGEDLKKYPAGPA